MKSALSQSRQDTLKEAIEKIKKEESYCNDCAVGDAIHFTKLMNTLHSLATGKEGENNK
jgi:hypothetical protein